MTKSLGVVGMVAVLFGPVHATAETVAVIALDGCDRPALTEEVKALRSAFSNTQGVKVQSLEETAAPVGGLSRHSLAEVGRVLSGARYEFNDRLAYDRVERILVSALEDLRTLPPSDERWQDERDANALLAYAYLKLNRRKDAERAMAKILRVEPEYKADPNSYPPSFRDFVDGVRSELKKTVNATLKISSKPSGLPIYVDGRPVGKAPLTLRVPAGEYRVEAAFGAGRRGAPRTVRVEQVTSVDLDQAFEGAIYPDAGPCLTTSGNRDERLGTMVRLATLFGVDTLVGLRHEEPSGGEKYVVALAVDAATGQEVREGRVKIFGTGLPEGSITRLAQFMVTGRAVVPVEPVRGGSAHPANERNGDGVAVAPHVMQAGRTPALRTASYAVGGGAVVALGAAVLFHLRANDAQNRIDSKAVGGIFPPGSEAEVASLRRDVSSNRTLTLICAGVGIAAAGTAGALFYLSTRGSGATAALTVSPTGLMVAGTW